MDSFVLVTHERSLLQEVCNRSLKWDRAVHIRKVIISYLYQKEEHRKYLQHRYMDTIEKLSVTSCKRRMSKNKAGTKGEAEAAKCFKQ